MHRLILTSIVIIYACCANAYEIKVDPLIKEAERRILSEMQSSKKTPEDYFKTYLHAAEEAVRISRIQEALYFYNQALSYDTKSDKFSIYSQMVGLSLFSGQKELGIKIYSDYEKEYSKKNRSSQNQAEYLMYKVLTTNKLHSEVLNKEEIKFMMKDSQVSKPIFQHDIEQYFNRSEFEKIYALYKNDGRAHTQMDDQIIYDLTSILAKQKHQLHCESKFREYPEAQFSSYSMTICGMLIQVQNGQKPNKQDLSRLQNILKNFPRKKFLYSAAQKLF